MKSIYLRVRREQLGLTQEQLEARARVPQATISRLETRDDVRVSADILMKLADALDVDPRELRFGPVPERAAS